MGLMFGQNQRWVAKFVSYELKNYEKNGTPSRFRATSIKQIY